MNLKVLGKEIFISKVVLVTACVFLAILIGSAGFFLLGDDRGIVFENTKDSGIIDSSGNAVSASTPNSSNTPVPTEDQGDVIKVYVTGCVKKPGLVTLKKGQLVDDAIKAAGGPTADADLNINMAYVLNDNVWINVKSKKENLQAAAENKTGTTPENDGTKTGFGKSSTGTGIEIKKDSGGAIVSGNDSGSSSGDVKININTATAEELEKIKGVGEKTAADIIEYREKNGLFKTITDITKVKGIGEKSLTV
jgi:competence protein ComEA